MAKRKRQRKLGTPRGAESKELPVFVTPMAAVAVKALPEGPEWRYELKLDGYRALMIKDGTRVEIRSRKDKDLTRMYPTVAAAGMRLNARQAVVDGEIVAVDSQGRPSFQALQHRSSFPDHRIAFYAFDLLHVDGRNLMGEALMERRARLPRVLGQSGLLLSQELPGSAADVVAAVRALGLEGVVAKHRSSTYQPGDRSSDWQKLKLEQQQEFVIGGYRPGSNGIDALLVGYYDEGAGLRFAAKVRAGFVPHVRREIFRKLQGLRVAPCPFVDLPHPEASRWGGGVTADEMREMQWVKPQLVAQFRFTEWTAEGRLRHAKFLGLRTDKHAREVRREG